MKLSHPVAKLAAALAVVCALGAPAAAQDDSALFSASVPPNVMLVIDNSGSMNEIMWHPGLVQNSASNCSIFGLETPNVGTGLPNSGNGTINGMPYTCDPANNHCRLELPTETTSGVTGWTTTGTYTCPDSTTRRIGYFQKTFCGRSRRLYVDPDNSCKGNRTWYSEVYLEWLFSAAANGIYLNNESNTSTDINMLDANRNGMHYVNGQPFPLYKRARITAA